MLLVVDPDAGDELVTTFVLLDTAHILSTYVASAVIAPGLVPSPAETAQLVPDTLAHPPSIELAVLAALVVIVAEPEGT